MKVQPLCGYFAVLPRVANCDHPPQPQSQDLHPFLTDHWLKVIRAWQDKQAFSGMRLRLPKSLHYPITVTELLKQPNDDVKLSAPLFSYQFKTIVTEGDEFGGEHQVEKTLPTRYESPVEGVLKVWRIEKGAVIDSPEYVAFLRRRLRDRLTCSSDVSSSVEVAEIEEPCPHSVQFAGMCTMCGKDMTTYVGALLLCSLERQC